MLPQRNHQLPLDLDAFRAAGHARGRVIVIAPTRAACETIELAFTLKLDTLLQRQHGKQLAELAASGKGFGIVAGTGVGKTLGIRPIAEAILQEPLFVGVVNRERESTPETPAWNVVIVTTGIARRWFEDDLITKRDTIVVDEIHQTSAELELCLALGKRAGCRFIWLSATVDPAFYRNYLNAAEVLQSSAFDPALKAKVKVVPARTQEFFDDKEVRRIIKEKRGVAVFVPTRAEVEGLAKDLGARWPRLTAAFYHGGEPIRVIRPFLEDEVQKPFLLAMTAAGQSALNIRGLDTVVIYDARYGNVVDRGRNVLHRLYLGANEILQMAGRVHGRVPGGEVYILSDRDVVFEQLRPGPPEFQLAGDAERVAVTCAAIGVDARDLDLPVPLDRAGYVKAVQTLTSRGLMENGKLTNYGRQVEAMPVERPWGELLVHADAAVAPVVAVCSNIDSLHRMCREERDLAGLMVKGSDHLTAYNVFAEAVNQCGRLGQVYGLPRQVFDEEKLAEWAERRGVLVKAIEDIALGTASVYRALELPLPEKMPYAGRAIQEAWGELVARIMPFELVIDERTAEGQEVRVGRSSFASSWGAVAGSIRWFADRFGVARASIEGTTLTHDQVRKHSSWERPRVIVSGPRKHQGLAITRKRTYFGFYLEDGNEDIKGDIPPELQPQAAEALARALLEGSTSHPRQGLVRRARHELDELWRRSGGLLETASPNSVRGLLAAQLEGVKNWEEFLSRPVGLDVETLVTQVQREALMALPTGVRIGGDMVSMDYEIEEGTGGVVRMKLREGQARRLQERELPRVDRPIRFAIQRGSHPPLLADTLPALRELLRQGLGGKHGQKKKGDRFKPPRHRRR
ncbi:MAG TPA: DEAD/DEAH box helicase [Gemmatimonadales bacterium]|nr:DEAD/DEAH box helicase [Gemmatimonadales bacterium]